MLLDSFQGLFCVDSNTRIEAEELKPGRPGLIHHVVRRRTGGAQPQISLNMGRAECLECRLATECLNLADRVMN